MDNIQPWAFYKGDESPPTLKFRWTGPKPTYIKISVDRLEAGKAESGGLSHEL